MKKESKSQQEINNFIVTTIDYNITRLSSCIWLLLSLMMRLLLDICTSLHLVNLLLLCPLLLRILDEVGSRGKVKPGPLLYPKWIPCQLVQLSSS
jgi:hypothetical protein